MARKSLIAALALATAGAIALPGLTFAASPDAMQPAADIQTRGAQIEPAAAYWWKNKNRHYNRQWHGNRYRYKHGAYNHYHNGWYYNSPWWLAGPIIGGALVGAYAAPRVYYDDDYDNGHVQYCLNRYRSYDPRTNTFLGYDGYRHECRGPY